MSVTVKIPEDSHPWRANINGVEYVYAAGSTQSVPEEVAQLIHEIETSAPVPAKVDPPIAPELPAVSAADNGKLLGVSVGKWDKVSETKELPAYTSSDNGKVLKVNSGGTGVEWGEASGGGGGAMIVEVTNASETYTAAKTFAEIAEAIKAGQDVILDVHADSESTVWHNRYTITEYYLPMSGDAYTNAAYITWTGHNPISTTKTPQVAHSQLRMVKSNAMAYTKESQS